MAITIILLITVTMMQMARTSCVFCLGSTHVCSIVWCVSPWDAQPLAMWNVTGLDTYMQYYAELFVFVLCVCGDRSIDVHVLAHVCVCLCCVGVVSFSACVCMCGRIDNDNHREM